MSTPGDTSEKQRRSSWLQPVRNPLKSALVGSGVVWVSVLLVPGLVLFGALARLVRAGGHDETVALWHVGEGTGSVRGAWLELLGDGARGAVLWGLYALVPLCFGTAVMLSAPGAVLTFDRTGVERLALISAQGVAVGGIPGFWLYLVFLFALLGLLTVLSLLLGPVASGEGTAVVEPAPELAATSVLSPSPLVAVFLLSLLAVTYVFPAALAVAVLGPRRSLLTGLDPRRLWPVLSSRRYARTWLVATPILLVGWGVHVASYAVWWFTPGLVGVTYAEVGDLAAVGVVLAATAVYFHAMSVWYTAVGRCVGRIRESQSSS